MLEFVQKLFETAGFLPYGYCYFWQPAILVTNVLGDAMVALALFAIVPTLYFILKKRKDISHKYVFVWFGVFILFCGLAHLVSIVTVWEPVYRFHGLVKVLTGMGALGAAFVLYRSVPQILKLPGLRHLEHV